MSPSRFGAAVAAVVVAVAGAVGGAAPARAAAAPAAAATGAPPAALTRGNADSPQQPATAGPQPRGAYVAPLPASAVRTTARPGVATRPSDIFGFAQAGEVASGAWRSDIQLNILTTLAYFGVPMNGDGSLNTTANGYYATWQGAQMTSLMQQAHQNGDRVVLTITAFDSATISDITNTESNRQAGVASIINQLRTRGGDGVNIDFEGGNASQSANLTTFISELRSGLDSQVPPQAYLTIDSYASAAMYAELYDIRGLAPYVDAFDIMDYDITSPSAANAGPVSPVQNATYSTVNVVNSYLRYVPATQVILGVPYYGYKWTTTDTNAGTPPGPNAATSGGGSADTYSNVLGDFSCALQLQQSWDANTEQPWAAWWSPSSGDPCGGNHGAWRELYWENQQSLGDKYSQVVNADQLRGIGIWALGYDSGHGELWNLIASSLRGYPLTPSAPQAPVVTGGAPQSATLSWQTPRFPAGDQYPVTTYTVTPYDEWGRAGTSQQVSGSTTNLVLSSLPDAQPLYFTVSATNQFGTGPSAVSFSATPPAAGSTPSGNEGVSTSSQQFALPNSDGDVWQVLGGNALSRSWTAASSGTALVTASADLWATQAGTNVDLGVMVDGSLVGWKEAGTAAAYSPVPAVVQTVVPVAAGSHLVQVVWKTNKPALGVIAAAGAGSATSPDGFSPSRLLVQAGPAGGPGNAGGVSLTTPPTTQDVLGEPIDGMQWRYVDRTLNVPVTPASTGTWMLTGNADLWTGTPGLNQDLGILVDGRVVAWKESGGTATYSPKATFVAVETTLTGGTTHWIALVWKTNSAAPGATVRAGAGSAGAYSPTRLTAVPDAPVVPAALVTSQPSTLNSTAGTWSTVDPALTLSIPGGQSQPVPLGASLDVWTSGGPVNLDVGIEVDGSLVAWKEVGLTRAYSPCALWVGVDAALASGTHAVAVVWRITGTASGARYAGAGGSPVFSVSELLAG